MLPSSENSASMDRPSSKRLVVAKNNVVKQLKSLITSPSVLGLHKQIAISPSRLMNVALSKDARIHTKTSRWNYAMHMILVKDTGRAREETKKHTLRMSGKDVSYLLSQPSFRSEST